MCFGPLVFTYNIIMTIQHFVSKLHLKSIHYIMERGPNYLASNVLLACRCEKSPLTALISSLAYGSESFLIFFDNLKSMVMQDSVMCNCRLALINIWKHHIYINAWIIRIISKHGSIILIYIIKYFTIRIKLWIRAIIIRVGRCS